MRASACWRRPPEQRTTIAPTPPNISHGSVSFAGLARRGFSIDQVQELLKLADQKDISCKAVDAIAREHLAEIDRKLRDLNTLRSELSNVIVQCGQGTISECRIIETLAPDSATFS